MLPDGICGLTESLVSVLLLFLLRVCGPTCKRPVIRILRSLDGTVRNGR